MTATDNRPFTLPVIIKNIPAAILYSSQLVNWKWEQRENKWTKIPVNPRNGSNASATNPRTWGEHTQVIKRLSLKTTAGFGYVLTDDGGIVAGDLDGCVDRDTRAIEPWAQTIITQMNTYTEYTPSGTGLRFYAYARLPFAGKRTGQVEIYTSKRFVTITGQRVPGTPATIEHRQSEIEAIVAELWPPKPEPKARPAQMPAQPDRRSVTNNDIIDKLLRNDKGRRLWNGDTSMHENNHSRADSALCAKLAYYTGHDPARIDELFKLSGLMREKWERADYREMTINGALNIVSDFYEWNPPTISFTDTNNGRQHPPHDEQRDDDGDCADQVAGLMARIDQLEARIRELDVPRDYLAEIERQAEEIRRLKDERTRFFEVLRNPPLKGIATTALAVYFGYESAVSRGKATEGWVEMSRTQTAENSGNRPGTVTEHMKFLENELGLIERDTTRISTRHVDTETGEVKYEWESCARIRLRTRTFEEYSEVLITYKPDRPERRGGYRPRCIEHPEAGTIVNRTVRCAECETVLEETETFVPAEPEILKDENHLSESPSTSVWLRTTTDENQLSEIETAAVALKDKVCISEPDPPIRPKNRCRCGGNAGDGELCSDCAREDTVLAREQRRLKGQHRGRHG